MEYASKICKTCKGRKFYNMYEDCAACRNKKGNQQFFCLICGGRTSMGRMNHKKCLSGMKEELYQIKLQALKKEFGFTDSKL